jgi:hypothetical protein
MAVEAAEQARAGHEPADGAGDEATEHLENPAGDDRTHADVPGMAGGGLPFHAAGQ